MSQQARWWIGTLNNPAEVLERTWERAKEKGAVYLGGQLEVGALGTDHFQFVVAFKQPTKLGTLKLIEPRGHWEKTRSEAAINYCFKEDTRLGGPWEYGTKPHKRNSKTDWEEVWSNAKKGDYEQIPAQVRVQNYRTLQAIAKDHRPSRPVEFPRGVFLYGEAGSGKSYAARKMYEGPIYTKDPMNKWWDGYAGQPVVLLDDFGKKGAEFIGDKLKNWLDVYEAFGESKGSQVPILATTIILTSNYSLEELFGHDEEGLLKPIKRRMRIIRKFQCWPTQGSYTEEQNTEIGRPISAEVEAELDAAQEALL